MNFFNEVLTDERIMRIALNSEKTNPDLLFTLFKKFADRTSRQPLPAGTSFYKYLEWSPEIITKIEQKSISIAEKLGVEGYNAFLRSGFRERNLTLLQNADPALYSNYINKLFPPKVQKALDRLFAEDIIGNTKDFGRARGKISDIMNETIAAKLNNINEYNQVIKLISEPGSRGSISELFFAKNLAGEKTAWEKFRHVLFDKETLGTEKGLIPDRIRPDSKRTLDIKSGYTDTDIDMAQMKNYEKLREESQVAGSAVQKQLKDLGIDDGLTGHEYLFLQGKKGQPPEAAIRAWDLIAKETKDPQKFAVYYSDNLGQIYKYNGSEVPVELIGFKLPD
jgi:hypothetical protein